jgi:hypothetical protein
MAQVEEDFQLHRVHEFQLVKQGVTECLALNERNHLCAVRLRAVKFDETDRVQAGHGSPARASDTTALRGLPVGVSLQTAFARARKSSVATGLAGTTMATTWSCCVTCTSSPAATQRRIFGPLLGHLLHTRGFHDHRLRHRCPRNKPANALDRLCACYLCLSPFSPVVRRSHPLRRCHQEFLPELLAAQAPTRSTGLNSELRSSAIHLSISLDMAWTCHSVLPQACTGIFDVGGKTLSPFAFGKRHCASDRINSGRARA